MAEEKSDQRRRWAAFMSFCFAAAAIVAIPFPMVKSICCPCNDEKAGHDAEIAEVETIPFGKDSPEMQIGVLYTTVLRRVGFPDEIRHEQKGQFTAIYYPGDSVFELTFRNENGRFRLLEFSGGARDW